MQKTTPANARVWVAMFGWQKVTAHFLEGHVAPLDYMPDWVCAKDIRAGGALLLLQSEDPLQGWAPPTRIWSLFVKLTSPGKHDLNSVCDPEQGCPRPHFRPVVRGLFCKKWAELSPKSFQRNAGRLGRAPRYPEEDGAQVQRKHSMFLRLDKG